MRRVSHAPKSSPDDSNVHGWGSHWTIRESSTGTMKLTLGIFNCKTRDKGFAWRILGYVKNFLPEATPKATGLLKHSGIRDVDNYLEASDSESDEEDVVDLLKTLAANQATHPAK